MCRIPPQYEAEQARRNQSRVEAEMIGLLNFNLLTTEERNKWEPYINCGDECGNEHHRAVYGLLETIVALRQRIVEMEGKCQR